MAAACVPGASRGGLRGPALGLRKQRFSQVVGLRNPDIKKSAPEFCGFQITNELHPRPRSEEIGALDALGCDFQGEIDVSDVGSAEIGTLKCLVRGLHKSTLA